MATEGTEIPAAPAPEQMTLSAEEQAQAALPVVNIGTRRSLLARAQTDIVEAALRAAWPGRRYKIHAMATMGDKNQTTALHEFGAKSLWTHELEALLETGELDMIVHSLKDMPTQLPPTLALGAITEREDARDAFVLKASLDATKYGHISALPAGSIIGTSSVRRSAQLKRMYPHLQFADVRGNLGTRLSKLDGTWTPEDPGAKVPAYTALILAAAGLRRIGLGDRITGYLSRKDGGMLHAVGQGALGIEVRADDKETLQLLSKVGCERTTRACLAERSLMRTLEGGCSVPIGVETEWVNEGSDELIMRAAVVAIEGDEAAEVELTKTVTSREAADEFGREVAQALVERGADKILERINLNRNVVVQQGNA